MYACMRASSNVSSTFVCFVGNVMFSVILVLYELICEKFQIFIYVHTAFTFQFLPSSFFSSIYLNNLALVFCRSPSFIF
jgi:hypothetical protein